ncbi:double-strand break repair helicase AddA [Youhaiella tibetensis]|uniref:DNA 3'-5' helicase n=2 Tax=Paradevosia tibetensis TaxID=1447062 RepID=A0A5B9DJX3_9HYPH|nr:double-strand break repair helicase AddA [Youhaiella tibetensis]
MDAARGGRGMSRQVKVSTLTRDRQRLAADPSASIWVAANAGSGKTYVLTQRVLRLLLSGVTPESILCLTYTKAAAAEMRARVSDRLASWAVAEEAKLRTELSELESGPVTPERLERARTLFAHALETPGGLKIVTIHAFCESVLHRFPLEAGVPFDFAVVEDEERLQMVLAARESVLSDGLKGHPEIAGAVATLFELMTDHAIGQAIEVALADGRKLRRVLADRPLAKTRLRELTRFDGEGSETILARIVDGQLIGPEDVQRVFSITPPKGGKAFEDELARTDLANVSANHLIGLYLTDKGLVPQRFPKADIKKKAPDLAARLLAEAERIEALNARLTHALLIERSEALLDVLGAISDRYEADKRARSLLDFDDLIERLGTLFRDGRQSAWVRYKLDAGITHMLVDESQDTNADQWQVIEAITDEFFAGEGAVERPRTVFAVGDEKQSIYSFQGANPLLFGETGRRYERKARDAGKSFERVPLQTSFRTLRNILLAVDKVFARDDIRRAVLAPEGEPHHDTARPDLGGRVTLWPPVAPPEDKTDASEWALEVPPRVEQDAARQVAERMAREIRGWIDNGRPLGTRGRTVTADDVLILVQSRNALFREIIRALVQRGLPTPGADRLAVTTHIAVLDLLALGDVVLNPADDLQLAALLRSPLFDISEDALYTIAHEREGTLWAALEASPLEQARAAYGMLHRWRGRADFDRPFEFYSRILYAEGGLRLFHRRFGGEVDDVFAEFLDLALSHEQGGQPSLQGFVASLRLRDIAIKRELAESGGGVRVMTVHGAKGLEAPIVILADATSKPDTKQTTKPVYVVHEGAGPLLIHAPSSDQHVRETMALRDADEANLKAEYWRKLYVAMTRAEDELYVTGALTKNGKIEGSWYEAIEGALVAEAARDDATGTLAFPAEAPPVANVRGWKASQPQFPLPFALPQLPEHRDRVVVTPSSAYEPADIDRSFRTTLEEAVDAETARRSGIALHALLQHLVRVAPGERDRVLEKALPALLPGAPELHGELAARAQAILTRPELAHLFGPNSRAEVPFLVKARRNSTPIWLAGRMDRIVVENGKVLVVDYKSDAQPPADPDSVHSGYKTQLGLYALVADQLFPGHNVEAAILWTRLESLMILPRPLLAKPVSAFTLER